MPPRATRPRPTVTAVADTPTAEGPTLAIVEAECANCFQVRAVALTIPAASQYGTPERHYCGACCATCQSCEEVFPRLHGYNTSGGSRICQFCVDSGAYRECDLCTIFVRADDAYAALSRNGERYVDLCESCFNDRAEHCGACGNDHLSARCPRCSTLLHSYDYRPEPRFYNAEGETEARYHFGFELEVEGSDSPPREMPEFVYCKTDGSLNDGFEVVSHPVSPAWLRKNRDQVVAMLRKLKDAGMESYDTDTCGMHIHVSRTAFDGTFHLLKFLELFYRWPSWTLVISQREEEYLTQWANCGASQSDIYRKAKIKANSHGDRYTAVNLENEATFEVRIFRGVLGVTDFFKNLQYIEAVVEFTRDESRRKVTPRAFRRWVRAQTKRYPDLVQWLQDGGHLRQLGNDNDQQRG